MIRTFDEAFDVMRQSHGIWTVEKHGIVREFGIDSWIQERVIAYRFVFVVMMPDGSVVEIEPTIEELMPIAAAIDRGDQETSDSLAIELADRYGPFR